MYRYHWEYTGDRVSARRVALRYTEYRVFQGYGHAVQRPDTVTHHIPPCPYGDTPCMSMGISGSIIRRREP